MHDLRKACPVSGPVTGNHHDNYCLGESEVLTGMHSRNWMAGQVISHLKNWAILRTDYRRRLKTFPETISAVIGLQFYKVA